VIAALALTHTRAGDNPFHMYRANAWNRISTGYRHFVAMDPDNDTAYFTYNYQATSTISFYKQKANADAARGKQDALTFDEAPTANSRNPVRIYG
jgi:hypothetical protein